MCPYVGEGAWENELPCEPAGHGEITTGSVSSCSPFWRAFVRSFILMQWIEDNYRLMWATETLQYKEMESSSSAQLHREFVTSAVAEMVTKKAFTLLPLGEKPWVVSPLRVVPKGETDKFRHTVKMRYVNHHLGQKAFKFEGLIDLADLVEKGDHAVS